MLVFEHEPHYQESCEKMINYYNEVNHEIWSETSKSDRDLISEKSTASELFISPRILVHLLCTVGLHCT